MIVTSVGQAAIKVLGKEYILTPSLAAMSEIENPLEVHQILNKPEHDFNERLELAHHVILTCSNDKGIKQYLGRQQIGKPKIRNGVKTTNYTTVYIDDIHAICIAQDLMFHGIIGKVVIKRATKESDYSNEFNAVEWMAAVVSHLEVSETEAWKMTMTSILAALKTKFPPSEKEKALLEYEQEKAAFDEWYNSIYGSENK